MLAQTVAKLALASKTINAPKKQNSQMMQSLDIIVLCCSCCEGHVVYFWCLVIVQAGENGQSRKPCTAPTWQETNHNTYKNCRRIRRPKMLTWLTTKQFQHMCKLSSIIIWWGCSCLVFVPVFGKIMSCITLPRISKGGSCGNDNQWGKINEEQGKTRVMERHTKMSNEEMPCKNPMVSSMWHNERWVLPPHGCVSILLIGTSSLCLISHWNVHPWFALMVLLVSNIRCRWNLRLKGCIQKFNVLYVSSFSESMFGGFGGVPFCQRECRFWLHTWVNPNHCTAPHLQFGWPGKAIMDELMTAHIASGGFLTWRVRGWSESNEGHWYKTRHVLPYVICKDLVSWFHLSWLKAKGNMMIICTDDTSE